MNGGCKTPRRPPHSHAAVHCQTTMHVHPDLVAKSVMQVRHPFGMPNP